MFPIAGQTAGPIVLKFFVDTKFFSKFFSKFVFHGQRRTLQLVLFKAV